jgi:DNA-directed RNA polymerase subunit alpha
VIKKSWVKFQLEGENYGRFIAEPLVKGYGVTLGNSLRRILLSSLEGAAITAIKIDGVSHEFEQIKGVIEDTLDIILNIKGIIVKSHSDTTKELKISYKGKGDITAKDIVHDDEVEILNPDHHLATLSEKGKVDITFWVDSGKGYVPSEANKKEDMDVDVMAIDASFSPIVKVNLNVEDTRVGKQTDLDKLTLDVWTNGTMSPEDAVKKSAEILMQNFNMFIEYNQKPEEEVAVEVVEDNKANNLNLTVEDLELSARSSNCLKKAGIDTVKELLDKDMRELMKIKNFGKKSADEINEKLSQYGYKLKDELGEMEEE